MQGEWNVNGQAIVCHHGTNKKFARVVIIVCILVISYNSFSYFTDISLIILSSIILFVYKQYWLLQKLSNESIHLFNEFIKTVPKNILLMTNDISLSEKSTNKELLIICEKLSEYLSENERRCSKSRTGIREIVDWNVYYKTAKITSTSEWWEKLYDEFGTKKYNYDDFFTLENINIDRGHADRIRMTHSELNEWSDKAIVHSWRCFSKAFYLVSFYYDTTVRHPEYLLYIEGSWINKEPLKQVPSKDNLDIAINKLWTKT